MKWIVAKEGDTRIKPWFAFFPVEIGNEVRWFERVYVKQVYTKSIYGGRVVFYWADVEFVDERSG